MFETENAVHRAVYSIDVMGMHKLAAYNRQIQKIENSTYSLQFTLVPTRTFN